MRRAAYYVGASVGAAAAVVLRAFHERPNFYSATVYLGQSTACRMILLNMLLLTLATSLYGLQRLLYGPLRAIEIEQLWDKAWYAITETALAMTTFRDEVGGYFFLMFVTLLAGKVWGWIGEGRVETLEQQPPANPKTFYARLTTSLIISELFDLLMFRYCLFSILDQRPPRAGMMIMFVFEFAILAINSASTLSRYGLALWERWVVKKQTDVKIVERREEIRAERALAARQPAEGAETQTQNDQSDADEPIEIDENEIDVPGWQEKGKWILFLDLTTDFLKLVFYMTFFMILIVFAGIPIHMFRDLFITTRSFIKRIHDYHKYRNATRDMNSRYPDATVEELERDGTCIICREEMRPWQTPNVPAGAQQNPTQPRRAPPDERQRPKKLPCGHILHFGCLRSWLERQQVCPTCRRSVLAPDPPRAASGQNGRANQANAAPGQYPARQQHPTQGPGQGPGQGGQQQPRDQPGQGRLPGINRMRTFNLGGIRLTFATGRGVNVRDAVNRMQNPANPALDHGVPVNPAMSGSGSDIATDLNNIERRIMHEVNSLNNSQQQMQLLRGMQAELTRLRMGHGAGNMPNAMPQQPQQPMGGVAMPIMPMFGPAPMMPNPMQMMMPPMPPGPASEQHILESQRGNELLRAGDGNLPEGMTLPEGWSLLPLNRMNVPQPGLPVPTRQTASPGPRAQTNNNRPASTQPTVIPRSQPESSADPTTSRPQGHNEDGDPPSTRSHATSESQTEPPVSQQGQESSVSNTNNASSESDVETTSQSEALPSSSADADLADEDSTDKTGSPTSIPQWSSSSSNGHASVDKGKTRAPQVEDADDDGT